MGYKTRKENAEMRIRWLAEAQQDLRNIRAYIAQDKPEAAAEVAQRIRAITAYLLDHPAIGRAGSIPGTRELVIPGLPYLIVYRVQRKIVQILAVLHGAQERQEEGK